MKPKKLFVFFNENTHFWYSCNVIVDAVKEAFSVNPEIIWCKGSEGLAPKDYEAIKTSAFTHETYLYLVSDNMIYQNIVEKLTHLSNLVYVIPVYGNMTVEFVRWPQLSEILENKKVILLAASHRQCQQLSVFVKDATIKKIPYPISEVHFTDYPQLVPDPTINLVYCGRLMVQKNIFELMSVFLKARMLDPNLKLHIAGDFHDRGYHLHGIDVNFEGFKIEFHRFIEESKGGIVFHGFLSQDKILELNAKCDYVISMSTYHDEDFGISVAQSLAQGLRPILSSWGGHPDYLEIVAGQLIPVLISKMNVPTVSTKHLFVALQNLKKLSREERLENREKIHTYLSTQAYLNSFQDLLLLQVKPYLGQNDFFMKYAAITSFWYPFYTGEPKGEIDYLEIYKSYMSDYLARDSYQLK